MDDVHSEDNPGIFIVGKSQSTKTTFMQKGIHADILADRKMTVTETHGQLTPRARDFTLTLPKSFRECTNYVCPADRVGPVPNLLAWNNRNEIPGVVDAARRIIKAAFGDPPRGDATPNIDFYMDAALEATALLRLPLSLAPDFIDRNVPHHPDLVQAVRSVDPTLSNRLDDISQMSTYEYLATAGPGLRRLDTVLKKNPYMRDLLSNAKTIDPHELLACRNFVNLKPVNTQTGKVMLRRMDQQFWACVWPQIVLQAAYSIDESERKEQHTLWYDEFQVLQSLFETTIQPALSEAAKFKIMQVAATQTVSNFHDGENSPMVQAFLANAKYFLLFPCQSDIDSRLFATIPHLFHFDPHRVKHVLTQKQQYVAGQDVGTLINRTYQWMRTSQRAIARSRGSQRSLTANRDQSWSAADSETDTASRQKGKRRSQSNAHTDGQNEGSGTNESDGSGDAYIPGHSNIDATKHDSHTSGKSKFNGNNHADTVMSGEDESENNGRSKAKGLTNTLGGSEGNGATFGENDNETFNSSDSLQEGGSVAYNQAMVPRYDWRTIIMSVQFLSEEEQRLWWQQVLVRMQKGQCLLHTSKYGTAHLVFDKPVHAVEAMPRYIEEERARFLTELQSRPTYLHSAKIEGQYDRIVRQLPSVLPGLNAPREGRLLLAPVVPGDLVLNDDASGEVPSDAPWKI